MLRGTNPDNHIVGILERGHDGRVGAAVPIIERHCGADSSEARVACGGTQTVLDRLERLNPCLNAFLTSFDEQALEGAKRAEQELAAGQPRGPLHSVPLALKDIFAMQGIQVTAGSKVLGTWIPDFDATVVAHLKAAGAIFVGTLNLYEFATGAVLNPHDGPTHNP